MTEKYYQAEVKAVETLDGSRLRVTFNDGFCAEIDLTPLIELDRIFASLKNPEEFKKVKVSEFGTLEWPGDLDLSSGSLRAWCEAGKFLDYPETNEWIGQHSEPTQKVA